MALPEKPASFHEILENDGHATSGRSAPTSPVDTARFRFRSSSAFESSIKEVPAASEERCSGSAQPGFCLNFFHELTISQWRIVAVRIRNRMIDVRFAIDVPDDERYDHILEEYSD